MKNILLILFFLILSINTIKTKKDESIPYSTVNWMSNLPDDKLILLINIPGAHDSATNEVLPIAESMARTQNRTIPELLKFGIRKLDVRAIMGSI